MLGESSSDFVIKNFQNLHNGRQQELTYDTIVHIFKNTVVYLSTLSLIIIIGTIKLWNLMISQ